jgi:hypothetical protein
MSDAAARFERDLAALSSGRALTAGADAAALVVAGRLAGADFASESRVKESLRAALLARAGRPALGGKHPFALRLPAGLAGALAAAAIVLLLLRPRAPAPPTLPIPALMVSESPRPASESHSPVEAAASPRMERPEAHADEGPFRRLSVASPFEVRRPVSGGSPFMTATARVARTPHGRAVVWQLPHATLLLEDRPVRIDELFVRPILQTSM